MGIKKSIRVIRRSSQMKTICRILLVTAFIIIVVNLSVTLSFKYLFRLENVETIRFHKRRLTFDTSLIKSPCNATFERNQNQRKEVDLRIFALTYNRPKSILRLLVSINKAIYGNSTVALEVWVDRSDSGQLDKDTQDVLNKFVFKHGDFRVCVHSRHVGILGQWLTPWKPNPNNDKEIAVLLEDDMTVSPYFYMYLKGVHAKYRHSPKINGFALQGLSRKHCDVRGCTNGDGNVIVNTKESVYLYPTLGTWGFSPNRKNWIMFLQWFEYKYNDKTFNPIVEKHVSSDWYVQFIQDGTVDNFWEVWHIFFSWANTEFTMYPNFGDHKGLTFNWKENGLHYTDQNVLDLDTDKQNILLEWKPEYNQLPDSVLVINNNGAVNTRLDLGLIKK